MTQFLTEEIVEEFKPIIKAIAKSRNSKTPSRQHLYEFENEGWLGLVDAYRLHESSKGDFSKYALSRIHGSIKDYQRSQDHLNKEDRTVYKNIEQSEIRLSQKLMRKPTEMEVLEESETSSRRHSDVMTRNASGCTEDSYELSRQNEYELNFNEPLKFLEIGLEGLSNRELKVFKMYHIDEMKGKDIAAHFKRCEAWASLKNKAILKKIRKKLRGFM